MGKDVMTAKDVKREKNSDELNKALNMKRVLEDKRHLMLREGITCIFKNLGMANLNTTVYELLRNFEVKTAIDFCQRFAHSLSLRQEHILLVCQDAAQS